MLKPLFASAAVFVAVVGPALAQVGPSEPMAPAERAQVRRDWNEMAREWEQRQRSTRVAAQGTPRSGGTGGGNSAPLSPGASPLVVRAPVPSLPGSRGGASPIPPRGTSPTPSGYPSAIPPQPLDAPLPGVSGSATATMTQGPGPNLPDRASPVALSLGPMGWGNNVVGVNVDVTNTSSAPIASMVLTCAFSEAGQVQATGRERVAALSPGERVRVTPIAEVGVHLIDAVQCRAE
jgi:hypothetical protein